MPAPRLAAIATPFVIGFCEYHESILPIEIRRIFWWFFLFCRFILHKKPCPEVTEQGCIAIGGSGFDSAQASLHLDLNIHAAGKLKLHQGVHGLGAVGIDIHQTFECAELKLLTRLLVYVW